MRKYSSKPLHILAKSSIFDVWLSSKYTYVIGFFCSKTLPLASFHCCLYLLQVSAMSISSCYQHNRECSHVNLKFQIFPNSFIQVLVVSTTWCEPFGDSLYNKNVFKKVLTRQTILFTLCIKGAHFGAYIISGSKLLKKRLLLFGLTCWLFWYDGKGTRKMILIIWFVVLFYSLLALLCQPVLLKLSTVCLLLANRV